jgi:glucosamine--fructose-6-phosphate aminotransferase (isomerizing)
VGQGENFLASDAMALAGVTDQIVYLAEGDVVDVQLNAHTVYDATQHVVLREVQTVKAHSGAAELGPYRHYMQKEIFEQPRAIADTLEGIEGIVPELFDHADRQGQAAEVFAAIDSVLILACGTSYYSACVAKYWLESLAQIPCQVEVASEYRYRDSVPDPRTLVVTISQSGETADTLAALRHAQSLGMKHTLTICNVATSAMVRECKLAYITRAGVEIGVASTKAFTTQLAGLFLLTLTLANAYEVCAADSATRSGLPTSGDKRTSGITTGCGSVTTCESATYRTSSRCISLLRGAIHLELEASCWTIGCSFRSTRKCCKSNSKTASRPSATP